MKVVLESTGHRKISVIKDLRQHLGLSLVLAKKLADQAPVEIPPCDTIHELIRDLEESGARVVVDGAETGQALVDEESQPGWVRVQASLWGEIASHLYCSKEPGAGGLYRKIVTKKEAPR